MREINEIKKTSGLIIRGGEKKNGFGGTYNIIEYKNGKPVEKTKNLFSGYLLVQMIMSDEAWFAVRNTPGVTGFIGSSGKGAKPFPVPQEEIDSVLRRLGNQDLNVAVDFQVGDTVQILNGPFKNSEGTVESMNEEKKEAKMEKARLADA